MKIIIIHGALPTLNEYINLERRNKYAAASMKKKATEKCRDYFLKYKFNTPIELEFLWLLKNKRKDIDNVAFAKKFILDGMVKAEAIANDGQKYVTGFRGDHVAISESEGVVIKIYEEGEQ